MRITLLYGIILMKKYNIKGKEKMSKSKKIILSALLLALLIILSRFLSIKTSLLSISFSFVPVILCAVWLGPKWTILVNALGDLIGAILFPFGSFFIGYTITKVVSGLIYGLLLYKKEEDTYSDKQFIIRLIISTILVTLIANVGMNTLWLKITTGKAFIVLLSARIVKELVMIPIEIFTMIILEKALRTPYNKYIRGEND